MINALFNQPNYVGAKKMLEATLLQHEAIATNIANLEKPRYQRVDLAPSFQTEFRRALAAKDVGQVASLQPKLAVDEAAVAANKDGNSVRLESELVQLSQNQLQHALETQLVSGNLMKLRQAITGRGA